MNEVPNKIIHEMYQYFEKYLVHAPRKTQLDVNTDIIPTFKHYYRTKAVTLVQRSYR